MTSIPKESNPSIPKYTAEHLKLIENESVKTRKLGGEILIDEWSTSGRKRPTVGTLLNILQKCELFRAADYIAIQLLRQVERPERPSNGPARQIDEQELLVKPTFDYTIEFLENEIIEVSYEQIERATGNFALKLGEGAFSVVYKGENNGKIPFAAKVLKEEMSDNFLNELKQLTEYVLSRFNCCSGAADF